ncbi:MAG: GxxExxY protein [Scytonema sp. PMC 1069.18]|nr:GxxExxY protein [Scytonema sp. PMC 1069.18]MEC4886919.1 GxxExxY protein [Scytonema sp. PMC 1070.18]
MNADERRWGLNEITEKVIGCAFTVGNGLGCGYLEKVYENALTYELRQMGLLVEQQYDIEVYYKGIVVGKFISDLLVERQVLVELKAVKTLEPNHLAQCLNYLKATRLNICLLINFGNPKVEFKRIAHNIQ